jgi:hypothetical protein
MTRSFRSAVLITAGLAAACGEGPPTAPSSTAALTAISTSPEPIPAPVSQTFTGTWSGGGLSFTITQNGTAVSGMMRESTISIGNGITLTERTTMIGTASGDDVTLLLNDRITIAGTGTTMNCTVGHTFTGALSGNTLSGTMVAGTTPLNCGRDLPTVPIPTISGPMTFTRQ